MISSVDCNMIRKVKREWTKKEKAFRTVDAWGDKKLPEINNAINRVPTRLILLTL